MPTPLLVKQTIQPSMIHETIIAPTHQCCDHHELHQLKIISLHTNCISSHLSTVKGGNNIFVTCDLGLCAFFSISPTDAWKLMHNQILSFEYFRGKKLSICKPNQFRLCLFPERQRLKSQFQVISVISKPIFTVGLEKENMLKTALKPKQTFYLGTV